ncbi:hypothetical protein V6667_05575 [Neisseria leonii]
MADDTAASAAKKVRTEVPLAEMSGYSADLSPATRGRAALKKYGEAPMHVAATVTEARKG